MPTPARAGADVGLIGLAVMGENLALDVHTADAIKEKLDRSRVAQARVRRYADEHGYGEGWYDDLLQRLGPQERAAHRFPSWLATERRRLGHAAALLPGAGVSRHCA